MLFYQVSGRMTKICNLSSIESHSLPVYLLIKLHLMSLALSSQLLAVKENTGQTQIKMQVCRKRIYLCLPSLQYRELLEGGGG